MPGKKALFDFLRPEEAILVFKTGAEAKRFLNRTSFEFFCHYYILEII
jgi:hypothetical protein